MSRHEVREEMKQHEGNPAVKRAIRGRQMAISRNRMIGLVSSADVVVVNPTHYAVALKYEATRGAPEVVAKGAGDVAKRIREEAEANGVPDRPRAGPLPDDLLGLRARPAHPRRPLRGRRPAAGLRLRPPGQGPGRGLPRAPQAGPPLEAPDQARRARLHIRSGSRRRRSDGVADAGQPGSADQYRVDGQDAVPRTARVESRSTVISQPHRTDRDPRRDRRDRRDDGRAVADRR